MCGYSTHVCVCVYVSLFLCYPICVRPVGGTSMYALLLWNGLSHYSIMWPCLIVSQHFPYHSSPPDKREWKQSREEGAADSALCERFRIEGGSSEQEQKPPEKAEV